MTKEVENAISLEEMAFEKYKFYSSCIYTGQFGLAGLLISLGTFTMYQLAERVNRDTTGIGGTFLPYGFGLFVGLMSIKLKNANIDILIACTLLVTVIVLVLLPFNHSLNMLYPYQFVLGACLAVLETCSMYYIRKIQGSNAGVWLGMTGSCLSIGFFALPLVMYISNDNIYWEYLVVAACCGVSALFLFYKAYHDIYSPTGTAAAAAAAAAAEGAEAEAEAEAVAVQCSDGLEMILCKDKENGKGDDNDAGKGQYKAADKDEGTEELSGSSPSPSPASPNPHYYVELLVCFILFIFIGMENSLGVYLQQFIDENTPVDPDGTRKDRYQLLFICTSSASKFLVPLFQYYCPKPRQVQLFLHACNLVSFIAALVWVLATPTSAVGVSATSAGASNGSQQALFLFFLAVNGISCGGTVSLCYDVANNLTNTNRTGVMLLTGGIYLGSSLFPWLFSEMWRNVGGARRHDSYPFMMVVVSLLVLVLCPLLPAVSYVRPDRKPRERLAPETASEADADAETKTEAAPASVEARQPMPRM